MKKIMKVLPLVLGLCLLPACSSPDDELPTKEDASYDPTLTDIEKKEDASYDPTLTDIEKKVLGLWQLEECYSFDTPVAINGTYMLEFRGDRTSVSYQDGKELYSQPFWIKSYPDRPEAFRLFHTEDEGWSSQTTYIEVDNDRLTINSYGCFNSTKEIFRRIRR